MAKYNQNFIDIQLSRDTVYVYSVRRAIQKALDENLHLFRGQLIDLGCGEMPYRQYILDRNRNVIKYTGVDIDHSQYHQAVRPDLVWDGKTIRIGNESVDTVVATELFEHISNLEEILKEIHRILAKDGGLFFTVPFIWPLHETPYDEYRYTPYSLERTLKVAGFKDIVIKPMGGYNAALAQVFGFWMCNRKNEIENKIKFKIFDRIEKYFFYPIIRKLLKWDNGLNHDTYGENSMPIGFYAYAKK